MKIAILGTENSHAYAFSQLIAGNEKYSDVEVVGLYGYDDEANKKIIEAGFAPYAADQPDAFLGKVDGIICTARHGDHHYEYSLPYIRAGIPCFIDKPFAVKTEYIDEMINLAKKTGAPLCGGSSLKYMDELKSAKRFLEKKSVVGGCVTAPVNMVNDYAGFYFYAQHLIEIMFAVFGEEVKSVYARCPDEQINRISVIFNYGNYDVLALYSSSYVYSLTVYAKEGMKTVTADDITYCYEHELDAFCDMVRSGHMPHSYESLARPAQLLRIIENSFREKKELPTGW